MMKTLGLRALLLATLSISTAYASGDAVNYKCFTVKKEYNEESSAIFGMRKSNSSIQLDVNLMAPMSRYKDTFINKFQTEAMGVTQRTDGSLDVYYYSDYDGVIREYIGRCYK